MGIVNFGTSRLQQTAETTTEDRIAATAAATTTAEDRMPGYKSPR